MRTPPSSWTPPPPPPTPRPPGYSSTLAPRPYPAQSHSAKFVFLLKLVNSFSPNKSHSPALKTNRELPSCSWDKTRYYRIQHIKILMELFHHLFLAGRCVPLHVSIAKINTNTYVPFPQTNCPTKTGRYRHGCRHDIPRCIRRRNEKWSQALHKLSSQGFRLPTVVVTALQKRGLSSCRHFLPAP